MACKSLILHYQRAGEHVMQAPFFIREANYDEADTEKHRRQDFGEEPSCGAAKANSVTGFIHDFEAQNSFPYRSLPRRARKQRFIKPLSNKRQRNVNEDRAYNRNDEFRRRRLLALLRFMCNADDCRQHHDEKQWGSDCAQDNVIDQVRQQTDPKPAINGRRSISDWRRGGISSRWSRSLAWSKAAGKG